MSACSARAPSAARSCARCSSGRRAWPHPTARRSCSPASRSGTWTGRARAGIPEELLTDAPGAPRRRPRRRRDRRGHGRRRAGADAGRGRARRRASAVVTANKHLLAHHGPELERDRPRGRQRRCASRRRSAAASPCSARSRWTCRRTGSTRVRGIVNGTTNYILTAMAREGRDYADVLAEAQARGYAEADPTRRRRGPRRGQQARDPRPAGVRGLDRSRAVVRPAGHDRDGRGAARASPGSPRATSPRWRPRAGCIRLLATARLADDGATRGVSRAHGRAGGLGVRALRRRAQPGRGRRRAGGPGGVRGPGAGGPATAARSSATWSRSRAGCGSTWAGAGAGARAIGARRAPRRVTNASPAPSGACYPVRGLRRPVISPDHAAAQARRALPRFLPVGPTRRRRSASARADAARPRPAARARPSGCANLYLKVEGQNPTGSSRTGGWSWPSPRRSRTAPGRHLRLDRQHVGLGRRLRRGRRPRVRRRPAGRPDRRRQAAPGAGRRRAGGRGRRQLRRGARGSSARWPSRTSTRSRSSTPSTRSGSRARRPPRSRSCDDLGRAPGRPRDPGRQRGQHQRPTGAASASTGRPGCVDAVPRMWGFQAAGAAPLVQRPPGRPARDGRDGDPDRQPGLVDARDRGARRVGRPDRRRSPTTRSSPPTATLARLEGVFCEPSSAASLAGVAKAARGRRARRRRARWCAC